MIKDRIAEGVRDVALKERLLEVTGLKFAKCISMCKAEEAASSHVKSMSKHDTEDMSHVRRTYPRKTMVVEHLDNPLLTTTKYLQHPYGRKSDHQPECKLCGLNHRLVKSQCPAWGKSCSSCGEKNRFARKCGKPSKSKSAHHVHNVTHEDYSSDDSDCVGAIKTLGK